MNQTIQERELLQGLAKNDQQAAKTIYKDNYDMVQGLITGNNGSIDDAKDIFQEAMVVLYEKARTGAFELSCQIKTYLYSVSRQLWLNRLRKAQKHSGDLEGLSGIIPVEEDIEGHEQNNIAFQTMEKALAELGQPCKGLITAYYLEKKSMTDIAGSFGYTNADNAKNQKYKCLMRLKKLFFSYYKNSDSDERRIYTGR